MDIDALASQFQTHVQGLSDLGVDFSGRGMVNIRGMMRPAGLVQHQLDRSSESVDITIPHEQGIIPHKVSATFDNGEMSTMIYRPAGTAPEHHMLYDPKGRIGTAFTDRVSSPDEFLDRLPEKMGSYDPMSIDEATRRGYGREAPFPYGGRHLVEDWSTFSHDNIDWSRGVDSYLTDPHSVNFEAIPPEERRR